MEGLMATRGGADAARALMIKYGLRAGPNDTLISQWRVRTNQLIAGGIEGERAGRTAAAEIFPDFQTHVYASEADDISSLLDAAGNR
jgi:hypothetical protein